MIPKTPLEVWKKKDDVPIWEHWGRLFNRYSSCFALKQTAAYFYFADQKDIFFVGNLGRVPKTHL